MSNNINCAVLSNDDKYTIFKYNDCTIRYKSPYTLEYYNNIKEWDNGYMVVMAKYSYSDDLIEEYIDLEPILYDLYIDKESFLKPIKEVIIKND